VYFNHGGISDFSAFFLSRSSVAHRVKMMAEGFDFIVSLWGDPKDFPIQNTKAKNIIIPNPISFDCENVAYGEKEKTILFVGRVVAVKGVEKIIEVWKELFHEFPDWNLRIVGDGKDKEKFEQLTEKYGMTSLKFEGASSHVKQFYKQADIFLFPSFWYEGMPMVLLEAMACKVAVIASDQDAHKNLIEGNGNGILVDATDNEAMIKELRNLILNTKLRKSMADKAYAYVQSYNIDEIEKRWEGILSR
jgi:glycosyltransferase involved in cell wall biosynthesis